MPTSPTPITALPDPPQTSSPSTFASKADAFIAALINFVTQANNLGTNVYNNASEAATSATTATTQATNATTQATNAANSATSAANVAGATLWVSGTTYTSGQCVYSPSNFQTYRRSTNGAGTTDPASDTTNWVCLTAAATTWTDQTGNFSVIANSSNLVDCTADRTATLPTVGLVANQTKARFKIKKGTGKLIFDGNGNKIMGSTETRYVTGVGNDVELLWSGTTEGWV